MFRLLAARTAARLDADRLAGQMILSMGGTPAMAKVRRDLRWLGPDEVVTERELTFLIRALEKRLGYKQPVEAEANRFLDKKT